jgi:hypothetical protein
MSRAERAGAEARAHQVMFDWLDTVWITCPNRNADKPDSHPMRRKS